jgi:hypothetical protein
MAMVVRNCCLQPAVIQVLQGKSNTDDTKSANAQAFSFSLPNSYFERIPHAYWCSSYYYPQTPGFLARFWRPAERQSRARPQADI